MWSVTYFLDFRRVIKEDSTTLVLSDAFGFPLHDFFVSSLTVTDDMHSLNCIP